MLDLLAYFGGKFEKYVSAAIINSWENKED